MVGGQVVVLVVLTGVGSNVPDSIMPQITCMPHWTLDPKKDNHSGAQKRLYYAPNITCMLHWTLIHHRPQKENHSGVQT